MMATDLHIHVLTEEAQERASTLRLPFNSNLIEYFHGPTITGGPLDNTRIMDVIGRIVLRTPHIWIAEVSWIKGQGLLLEEERTLIPYSIGKLFHLIGQDVVTLTPTLLEEIVTILTFTTSPSNNISLPGPVRAFLSKHVGQLIFQVGW